MSQTRDQIKNKVELLIRDGENLIDEQDYYDALDSAVRYYSEGVPYEKIFSETGDGSTFEWDVPSDFYPGFSTIIRVEHPARESGERHLQELEIKREWDIVMDGTGSYKFRLMLATPTSSEKVDWTYTTLHTLSDESNTLPSLAAEEAVTFGTAAILCMQLSAHYSGAIDATIDADAVDYVDKQGRYQALAEKYGQMSGLSQILENFSVAPVAFAVRDFDPPPLYSPRGDFLIHTRIRR